MNDFLKDIILTNKNELIKTNNLRKTLIDLNNLKSYENNIIISTTLPYLDEPNKEYELSIKTVAKEIICFSMAINLLDQVSEFDNNKLLFEHLNKLLVKNNGRLLTNKNDLLNDLMYTLNYYKGQYNNLLKTGSFSKDLGDLNIEYLDIDRFTNYIMKVTPYNKACFVINGDLLSPIEQKIVNELLINNSNNYFKVIYSDENYLDTDLKDRAIINNNNFMMVELENNNHVRVLKNY